MVGELILGRFRIERAIGSGGFGTVYRAWDERLQRPVAVKVIDGSDAAPRVVREAQAVARLAHRNIATLYELSGDGDRAFLVSELIEGDTLRALGRRGELNDSLVAEIGADAAAALAHAHRNGVVHRDVKPENILVARGRGGEARRLRDRPGRRRAHADGHRRRPRHPRLHGARAGRRPAARSRRGRLLAGADPLRMLLRRAPADSRERRGDRARDRRGGGAARRRPARPSRRRSPTRSTRRSTPTPSCARSPRSSRERSRPTPQSSTATPLPAVLRPLEEDAPHALRLPGGHSLARLAPALATGSLTFAALLVAGGSPGPVLLAAPLAAVLALGRPKAGLAAGVIALVAWLAIGAGQPGAALLVSVLARRWLSSPLPQAAGVALPGLAPLLGAAGIAAAYPAFAGLALGTRSRLLLGALGYLWLAAWELGSGSDLLLGPRGGGTRRMGRFDRNDDQRRDRAAARSLRAHRRGGLGRRGGGPAAPRQGPIACPRPDRRPDLGCGPDLGAPARRGIGRRADRAAARSGGSGVRGGVRGTTPERGVRQAPRRRGRGEWRRDRLGFPLCRSGTRRPSAASPQESRHQRSTQP